MTKEEPTSSPARPPQGLDRRPDDWHAPRVFINYRRDDAAGDAGRLFDALSARFGQGSVFMDVDSIKAGADFAEVINQAVGSCDVLVTVIGKSWLSVANPDGRRRLDDPRDLVRLEIQSALKQKILVVPALVQGAQMPKADELPKSLAKLAGRNAFEISHGRWQQDVERLISILKMPTQQRGAALNNLPRHLTSFVGRSEDVNVVKQMLPKARLVTLTGTGGCGKTRLALEVAAGLLNEYRDGVWFVEFAPVTDPELVPNVVASILDAHEQRGQDLTKTLIARLQQQHVLIVLDNCEHLVTACATLADGLLRACPDLGILATSREALNVSGEVSHRVPSLGLPREADKLHAIAESDAVQLFIDRARLARPDFTLSETNGSAVAEVCRRLDGIPLAIELASARVRMMPPGEILARLDDRFRLLTGGSRTAMARQQTLQAAVDWSHDLLSSRERTLFRRLAVFSGGGSLEAIEAICAGDVEPETVLELLDSLVAKSLVMPDLRGEVARYRLLETIRQYAQQKLIDSGEAQSVTDRHLEYYWTLARRLTDDWFKRGDEETWGNAFFTEGGNLRAAFDRAVAAEHWARATYLAASLSLFWTWEGNWSEIAPYIRRVEAHMDECPIETAAFAVSVLCWIAGTREQERASAQRLITLVGERPATALLAACLAQGHLMLAWTDESPDENINASLDAARRGSGVTEVFYLNRAAEAWISRGDASRGRDLAQQAFDLCQPRWLGLRADASRFLAVAARASGDWSSAHRFAERAVADARARPRFRSPLLSALSILSETSVVDGDEIGAMLAATEMVDLARTLGALTLADAYNTLGVVAGRAGDTDRAREALHHGLALKTADSDVGKVLILGNLGALDLLDGRYEQAEGRARECLAVAKVAGKGVPRSLNLLGLLAARRGDLSSALSFHGEAYRAFGVPESDELDVILSLDEMALTVVGLAGAIAGERAVDAARLLGATDAVTSPAAFFSVIRRFERDRLKALLVEQLGNDSYTSAVAAGRALSRQDALNLVESIVVSDIG